MKEFLKYTLATVTGIILTGAAFFVLSVITLIGMIAASSGTETRVEKNSIFTLELNGTVEERYAESLLDQYFGDDFITYGLDDILSSIKKAKENNDINGIYLKAGNFACGSASLTAIRKALLDFKKSGKFIIAYGGQYTQATYYICSVADKLILNPSGNISWHGLSAQTMFYKGLLDKIGVEMQVFRVGTYKAAVEPFIATEMSAANREQTEAFIGSIWQQMLADIAQSRGILPKVLDSLAEQNMDFQPAETYISTGMADTLMYKDEVVSYLKEINGYDDLNLLSLGDMKNVRRNTPKDKSGNVIAVYYAAGEIDGGSPNDGIESDKMARDLRKLREDESVKAVVLRVNSPGGSAYGSEQIWREVEMLKQTKPVVVSMGDYAASGGYYLSCAAHKIVAEPTTLTGSIGIFGMVPNAKGLIQDKLGLKFDVVKTNKYADMGQISRPFNEDEKALMQNMVNNGYELFTKRCADGRHMSQDSIKHIAEGRVWTGEMAQKLNLVDELGGLDKAVAIAKNMAQLETYSLVDYPEKEDFFSALLNTGVEHYVESRLIKGNYDEYLKGFSLLQNIENADRLQARMPFIISIN